MTHVVDTGRINQKRRTRNAILTAAAALVRHGQVPTVAEAADAASISRATAYRYFRSQEQLLIEATLETTTPLIEQQIDQSTPSDDPALRLDTVVHAIQTTVLANEAAFRAMLRLALELEPHVPDQSASNQPRGARRIRWIDDALAPMRSHVSPPHYIRLIAALALCVGIESIVVLRDICDLGPDEAEAVTRWAAQTLLHTAMTQA